MNRRAFIRAVASTLGVSVAAVAGVPMPSLPPRNVISRGFLDGRQPISGGIEVSRIYIYQDKRSSDAFFDAMDEYTRAFARELATDMDRRLVRRLRL
jgi:hypothetical protein